MLRITRLVVGRKGRTLLRSRLERCGQGSNKQTMISCGSFGEGSHMFESKGEPFFEGLHMTSSYCSLDCSSKKLLRALSCDAMGQCSTSHSNRVHFAERQGNGPAYTKMSLRVRSSCHNR